MRVRVLHDDYIRLHVCPVLESESKETVVPLEKSILTASCKSVACNWHSGDMVSNLSTHKEYDVILTKTPPRTTLASVVSSQATITSSCTLFLFKADTSQSRATATSARCSV